MAKVLNEQIGVFWRVMVAPMYMVQRGIHIIAKCKTVYTYLDIILRFLTTFSLNSLSLSAFPKGNDPKE